MALVAATVVVANPVTPAAKDMQISTTQLSTSPGLLSPFDKSLLNAITPQFPAADIGPALAQILTALAADADRISRAVNSEVSSESPVAPPLPDVVAYRPVPPEEPSIASADAAPSLPAAAVGPSVVASDVQQALSGLVADTSYLGGKVVEAAYAAVDVIISVPQLVATAASALLRGNIVEVLETVQKAITAFLNPALIILGGIGDVLQFHVPSLSVPGALAVGAATDTGAGTPPRAAASDTGQDAAAASTVAAQPGEAPAPSPSGSATPSAKRATTSRPRSLRATATAEPSDGNGAQEPKSTAANPPAAAAQPSSPATGIEQAKPAAPRSAASRGDRPAPGSARSESGTSTGRGPAPGA
ncbi:hypothetical protein B1R94_06795 [Mycolicibacterium litorale]|nr:hypothetical protein B1R94_06795 [Mycolicibacterium litorale]